MKENELKEKMVAIVRSIKSNCSTDCYHCEMDKERQKYKISCNDLRIINAFIAYGIGDVSEYKQRAEVAEKALYDIARISITESGHKCVKADTDKCQECRIIFSDGTDEGEHELAECLVKELLKQSERELQEEKH